MLADADGQCISLLIEGRIRVTQEEVHQGVHSPACHTPERRPIDRKGYLVKLCVAYAGG